MAPPIRNEERYFLLVDRQLIARQIQLDQKQPFRATAGRADRCRQTALASIHLHFKGSSDQDHKTELRIRRPLAYPFADCRTRYCTQPLDVNKNLLLRIPRHAWLWSLSPGLAIKRCI